ncbi:hypothetical protein QCE63_15570 [Caballeronia sp. LZ065]|uniref:hypothetical protein n=1 Tax=Caballeronia sp. LZ065 TaxID=3038571 RepID=UPI00285DCED5|nr:hypothetical protein [Caballeronia sp. LZ065]MDR5780842.1 hypothetical protein [Caballeronia sp. LZ065]
MAQSPALATLFFIGTTVVTSEGFDFSETVVRPRSCAGWRIEFPHGDGCFAVVTATQAEALRLAVRVRPDVPVRMLLDASASL